jgi:hypothetical protein
LIVVAAGMPKSGTGWWFNVHNDMLVAAGHADARDVRRRFALDDVLRHHNCLLDDTAPRTLRRLLRPALCATFVVKTHARPSRSLQALLRSGAWKATSLHRDPRDAALSAFEHGARARREGAPSAFASLTSLASALELMARELAAAEAWLACPRVLVQRYEDLVAAPAREAERVRAFLGLPLEAGAIDRILQARRREAEDRIDGWEHQHFNVGEVGRHRAAFSPRERALAEARFGPFLRRAGYEP